MKRAVLLLISCALSLPCTIFAGAKAPSVTTDKPQKDKVYPIAIIGAGAGGTMAVKRAILNNREVLLFTGGKTEMTRSRGNWVRKVDNVPGLESYKRAIVELRDEVLEDLVKGPFKKNLFVIKDSVTSIKKSDNVFTLADKAGHTYRARYLVLATGMMDEQPHIKGSIRPILSYANKQTVAYCLLCDGHRSYKQNTVVFGHSDEAGKAAILIADRYEPLKVTLLTNGKKPEWSADTEKLLLSRRIDVREEPIEKLLGASKGVLKGIELQGKKTVAATMGFVFLGIRPNNGLALEMGAECDQRGLIVTDENGESSIPNLFVVGDLRANSTKQIYSAWQHAVDSVQVIDRRIRAEKNG